MLWTPNKPIFETKNVPHKIGPWKFRYQGQIALFGPPGTQKGPDTRSKCVVSMSPSKADQSGAVGTKLGPSGPSEDLRGPQKGHFGQKKGPFRTPRGAEVDRYQVKVCGEHESIQGGPIGGSRDEIWPLGALPEPQKGHFGPKRALFACF